MQRIEAFPIAVGFLTRPSRIAAPSSRGPLIVVAGDRIAASVIAGANGMEVHVSDVGDVAMDR
jgi:hypothetical protein